MAKAAAKSESEPITVAQAIQDIGVGAQSHWDLLWLHTTEEKRALVDISDQMDGLGTVVYTWSCVSGIRRRNTTVAARAAAEAAKMEAEKSGKKTNFKPAQFAYGQTETDSTTPGECLAWIEKYTQDGGRPDGGRTLFVLLELDEFVEPDPVLRRKLFEMAPEMAAAGSIMMILSPRSSTPPKSLETICTRVDLTTPTAEEFHRRLIQYRNSVAEKAKSGGTSGNKITDDEMLRASRVAPGLTRQAFDQAVRTSIKQHGGMTVHLIQELGEQKKRVINASGFLTYEEAAESLDTLGGQDLLKDWLVKRMLAFGPEARAFGLPEPKGMLFAGPPGVGKSLGARAAASAWGRPLLRLDVGALFGGIVGESESNMRKAISLIESVSPCVVWIDEIEKGFAGSESSGKTDGGTSSRVFQSLLTWLNEKKSAVFVFATANSPWTLPAEMLRKGRFDEIFAGSLPVFAERQEILAIHLKKKKRDPATFDLAKIAASTGDFSGAELEQCVIDAMFTAFAEGEALQTKHLIASAKATQPLAQTMPEQINQMKEWAAARARPTSSHGEGPSVAVKAIAQQLTASGDPIGVAPNEGYIEID